MSVIFFSLLGACIGSWLTVFSSLEPGKRIWTGKSRCEACHTDLRWYELIPIISYALQGGKCRHCTQSIPSIALVSEIIMAIMFGLVSWSWQVGSIQTSGMAFLLISLSCLWLLALTDIVSGTLPDMLSFPMIFLAVGASFLSVSVFVVWQDALFGAFLGYCFFMIQMIIPAVRHYFHTVGLSAIFSPMSAFVLFPFWAILSLFLGESRADTLVPAISRLEQAPTWVGSGDIRLGILLGLLLGPYNFFVAIMIGYVLGSLWYFLQLLRGRRCTSLPVAPLVFMGYCGIFLMQLFPIL